MDEVHHTEHSQRSEPEEELARPICRSAVKDALGDNRDEENEQIEHIPHASQVSAFVHDQTTIQNLN
jgi:hypothetical protein